MPVWHHNMEAMEKKQTAKPNLTSHQTWQVYVGWSTSELPHWLQCMAYRLANQAAIHSSNNLCGSLLKIKILLFHDKPSLSNTIQAKQLFKQLATCHGITINSYHCDNGHFADNAFTADCKQHQQGLPFCGINAHQQNGIAKEAIRDNQEQAQNSYCMLYTIGKIVCTLPYGLMHSKTWST